MEKERFETKFRGWEARYYVEAKQYASTQLRIYELETQATLGLA